MSELRGPPFEQVLLLVKILSSSPQKFTQNKPAANPDELVCVTHVTADRIYRGSRANGKSDWLSHSGLFIALLSSGVRDVDGSGGL